MPRLSMTQLQALVDADFPDNTTRIITPATMRSFLHDFLDTMTPAYCAVTRAVAQAFALTTTPQAVTYTASVTVQAPEWSANLVSGVMSRSEAATTRFTFTADMALAANRLVILTLYVNGIATAWRQTLQGTGATSPDSVTFSGINYASAAATYEVRASVDVNTTVTFSNVELVLENVPVRVFT
jgi:hypothetical protein